MPKFEEDLPPLIDDDDDDDDDEMDDDGIDDVAPAESE
jgi:hypothetical protein